MVVGREGGWRLRTSLPVSRRRPSPARRRCRCGHRPLSPPARQWPSTEVSGSAVRNASAGPNTTGRPDNAPSLSAGYSRPRGSGRPRWGQPKRSAKKKGASAGRASSAVSWGSATRSAEGGGYHRLRIVKEYSMGKAGTWSACERDSGKWREGRWLDSGDRPGEDGGALVVEDCSQHQQEQK
jgi:hypothetical protein